MNYIVTIHHGSLKWVPLQKRYIQRNLDCRVIAGYSEIRDFDESDFWRIIRANASGRVNKRHSTNLQTLADEVCKVGKNDDIMIFMDGDAFPIAPLDDFLKEKLSQYKLVAIRRDEEEYEGSSEYWPHPCFLATSVGFWKDMKGSWLKGQPAFYENFKKTGEAWYPILRSHSLTKHKSLFGIYGNKIYHHGAGFRPPLTKVDFQPGKGRFTRISPWNIRTSRDLFDKINNQDRFFDKWLKK